MLVCLVIFLAGVALGRLLRLFVGRRAENADLSQYPIIETVNGALYLVIVLVKDISWESILFCLAASGLLALSVIDWHTFEIPASINFFLFLLGILHVILDDSNWLDYMIGFFAVSGFLLLLLILSRGAAIGGGDVKLMAVAGLLLGWKSILLAFLIGCGLGALFHLVRMKVCGAGRVLAMGPYLSAGILISYLWGEAIIAQYLSLL